MDEQVKNAATAMVVKAGLLADTIETVAGKVVNFLDAFAVNMEKQIDKREAEDAQREAAKQRHPAGKGRVDGEPTRDEKIHVIQEWVKTVTLDTSNNTWFKDPDAVSDPIVNQTYNYVKGL